MPQNANILWKQCADYLRDNCHLTPSVYNTWFAPLEVVEFENNKLVLLVKSQFVAEYIEENYIHILATAIRRYFGENTMLEYRVLVDSTSGAGATYPSENRVAASNPTIRQEKELAVPQMSWDAQLNRNYTFDNYIAGESNRMAITAARQIVKEPGRTIFNPLFVYGGSGVGKTHLANAIGNAIAQQMGTTRVLYVGANTFKLQYQEAVQQQKQAEFLLFYQSVDVLIVDDIQFFSGLKGTQDTFFHIFNHLHQSQKQLILTSDRSPLQLRDVQDRLLSRFKWGLAVEILRPEYALRRAILLEKMRHNGLEMPDEIVDYIAHNACQNVRDIEGILASLMAYSTLMDKEIDMPLVQSVLARIVEVTPVDILPSDIVGAVCEYTGVTEKVLVSQCRQKDVARARQLVIYLMKNLTHHSLNEIGQMVGKRSHATIIHTLNMVQDQLKYDRVLKHDLELLENELSRN